MKESGGVALFELPQICYNELEAAPEALLNATLVWVPISSVMWAGIIYAVLRVFH